MLETLGSIVFLVVVTIYIYAGNEAINYIKVNIMGVRAEIYNDTIGYYGQKIFMAAAFGWAAIPIALIHKNFIAK